MTGELHAPSLRHDQRDGLVIRKSPPLPPHTTRLRLLADHMQNAAHTPPATISPPNVAQDSIKNSSGCPRWGCDEHSSTSHTCMALRKVLNKYHWSCLHLFRVRVK